MKKLAVVLLLIAFCVPSVAYAASPWTEKETWAEKTTAKLDFGVKNVLGGWTEIYTKPEAVKNDGTKAIFKAIGEGLYYAVTDTVGGVIHLVTFPVPVDVPLPNNGVQLS